MRCSNCSAEIKPVVVFDVDGTLADYHNHLERFCGEYWAQQRGWTQLSWDGEGEFEHYLGLTKAEYREAKLAFRMGGQKRNMPPYYDTVAYVRTLGMDPRLELWICSSRPWQRLDNVDPDTRFWLERYQIRYDGLIFGDDKYAELLERIDADRIVMAVEDLHDQFDRAKDLDIPVVQIARDHNRGSSVSRTPRLTVSQLGAALASSLLEFGLETTDVGIINAAGQA